MLGLGSAFLDDLPFQVDLTPIAVVVSEEYGHGSEKSSSKSPSSFRFDTKDVASELAYSCFRLHISRQAGTRS